MASKVVTRKIAQPEDMPEKCVQCNQNPCKARIKRKNAELWLCQNCLSDVKALFEMEGTIRNMRRGGSNPAPAPAGASAPPAAATASNSAPAGADQAPAKKLGPVDQLCLEVFRNYLLVSNRLPDSHISDVWDTEGAMKDYVFKILLEVVFPQFSISEVQEEFKAADKNRDLRISEGEFLLYFQKKLVMSSDEEKTQLLRKALDPARLLKAEFLKSCEDIFHIYLVLSNDKAGQKVTLPRKYFHKANESRLLAAEDHPALTVTSGKMDQDLFDLMLAKFFAHLSPEDRLSLFKAADKNGDLQIDRDEWMICCEKYQPSSIDDLRSQTLFAVEAACRKL